MTPSQARRKSKLLSIIATPLILLPLLTLLMSFLKATYLATLEFRPIRFVAMQIHRLYNNLIHDTILLDVWWFLAPVPAPRDLASMPNLHIALLGSYSSERSSTERGAISRSGYAMRNGEGRTGSGKTTLTADP